MHLLSFFRMVNKTKRVIKISAEVYQVLRLQSKKEKKSMGEIATTIIAAALSADHVANSHGEQYDKKGNRIFRSEPF